MGEVWRRRSSLALLLIPLVVSGEQQRITTVPQVRGLGREVVQVTNVTVGGEVELACTVGHRVGRVQWVRAGLALGYSYPNITGFPRSLLLSLHPSLLLKHSTPPLLPPPPRYRMVGDRAAGEYTLRILGVQRVDEGYWECQVSGPPPLRQGAPLWVDLPPTAIALEPAEEGRVGINTTLTCRVLGGRPVATVVWLRAGAEFTGIEVVTTEEEVEAGRTTVASSLVFGPQPSDNGALFECLGRHPATPGGLRATLTLSVLSPPGRPVVTVVGHARGQVLRSGQEVTLHCESWGGEPRATLSWLRDGERVAPTGWTNRDQRAVSEHKFKVKEEDNNAVFQCEATSTRLELVLVEAIQLVVEFATSKVKLSGPDAGEVGDVLTFDCDSGTSNPASTLHWVVDSRNMTANYTTTEASDHGGFVTRSNLTLAITESVRYKQVNCYADNLALSSDDSFASHRVTVTYPPDHLSVSGYTPGQVRLLLLLLLLLLLQLLLLLLLFFLLLTRAGAPGEQRHQDQVHRQDGQPPPRAPLV